MLFRSQNWLLAHPALRTIAIYSPLPGEVDLSAIILARPDLTWVYPKIVGQTPVIEPGGHFSYNSYHVVARGAKVSGAFFGETATGDWVFSRIPEFRLEVPGWA